MTPEQKQFTGALVLLTVLLTLGITVCMVMVWRTLAG